jgi:HEAT repeat protein
MPHPDIPHLLADLRGRYAIPRKKAIDALVEIGAEAVPGLIDVLNGKTSEAREAAVEALTRIGTPEAVAAVEKYRSA